MLLESEIRKYNLSMDDQVIGRAEVVASTPAGRTNETDWTSPPGSKEVLALATLCCLVYLATILAFADYWPLVKTFGDNKAYTFTAEAIARWDIASIHTWQFWGLPYAMTAFSYLTRTSSWTALLFFSITGSAVVAVVASNRLWGGWVAAYFAVISRDWFERTVLGGAEPLFLALLCGSFWAARRQRWLVAAMLAAFSTVVRPMGIFALVGIGLVLLWRKQYKTLAYACSDRNGYWRVIRCPPQDLSGNNDGKRYRLYRSGQQSRESRHLSIRRFVSSSNRAWTSERHAGCGRGKNYNPESGTRSALDRVRCARHLCDVL